MEGDPSGPRSSVLASLLDEPLVVVDAGCRWGFAQAWERLGGHATIIGFDPDEAECARLRESYRSIPQVRVVAQGLGAAGGNAVLHVTEDPGGCSLLPSVPEVVERHPALAGGRVTGTAQVSVVTLDEWLAGEGIERVDVLKMDTQGSELGILQGGRRALTTVRAIEVEVEFNALYVDVPLFADIDRFLREHGFVLWRLRDLAHYAQRGAPLDWRAPEAQYFDDFVARFESGSGQLFWANAFYVKRDVVYPEPAAGWRALVRDACVTSALGFHDLAGLAITGAMASAPEPVATRLRAAGEDDLVAAKDTRASGAGRIVLQGTHVLDAADPAFRGSGWRAPQALGWGSVRWTGPQREASVDLPFRLAPGARVEILVATAMSPAIIEGLTLEVNRSPVDLDRSPDEHGVLYRGRLPSDYASPRLFTRLVLRTPVTVPWNELDPQSTDDTELGVAVAWIRLMSEDSA
ncbi:MAG TPA: FkbM family methyltransferase [Acidimicrobiales bacterium]|nr:FkbM family methyltransferase [Acidimicrobiales bacterium]